MIICMVVSENGLYTRWRTIIGVQVVLGLRVRCRISLGNSGGLGPHGKMAATAVVCAVLGHSRAEITGSDSLQTGAVPEIWGGCILSTHLHPKPQMYTGSSTLE